MAKVFGIGNRTRCNAVEIVHDPLRAAAIHLSGKRFAAPAIGTESESIDDLGHFSPGAAATARTSLLELSALRGNGLIKKSNADCDYKNRRVDLLHVISLFVASNTRFDILV